MLFSTRFIGHAGPSVVQGGQILGDLGMLDTAVTVHDLRRRWKPHKLRLGSHPTAIRFHRACSWLDRAERLDGAVDPDLVLINQWIALNALYGRWDAGACEPLPDRES